ncbi:MAG: hypothetical protein ACXVCY_13400 [Pseudobdellovibrionaceae bacterium]
MKLLNKILLFFAFTLSVQANAGGLNIKVPTLDDIKQSLDNTYHDIGDLGNDMGKAEGHLFGPVIGHYVREGYNVLTLGEVGRQTDRERAAADAAEAVTEKRVEDARVQQYILGEKQLINDQYQAYMMTKDNLELSVEAKMQMSTVLNQLQDIVNNFADYQAAVLKIEEANSAEMDLLENAQKYSSKLTAALEDFSTNGDNEKISNFYNRAIDRARAYRVSTKKYIGLIMAKSAMGANGSQIQDLDKKLSIFSTSLNILKVQVDAIVSGETKQANVHLANMRTYMQGLKNLNVAYCGSEQGLPPCDLFQERLSNDK